MSGFFVDARLHFTAIESYRINGWRGLCSFEGIVAPDGSYLFGCELVLHGADRVLPGEEVEASLRFWAPRALAPGLTPGIGLRLFEGPNEVASGIALNVRDEEPTAVPDKDL